MKIAIIGQGYVGLTISAFASAHFKVLGFDNNAKIVDQLNSGISHIEGVDSSLIAKAVASGNYRASSSGSDIAGSDVVVIAIISDEYVPEEVFANPCTKYVVEGCSSLVSPPNPPPYPLIPLP